MKAATVFLISLWFIRTKRQLIEERNYKELIRAIARVEQREQERQEALRRYEELMDEYLEQFQYWIVEFYNRLW